MQLPHRMPRPQELERLSSEERAEIAAIYLEGVQPGRQPLSLFKQLQRIAVGSTVEFVPVRTNESNTTEVLLTKRGSTDPWWPNQWHVPGIVLLPTEDTDDQHSYRGPINRVISKELASAVRVTSAPCLLDVHLEHGLRGTESKIIHWAEIAQVDELPPNGKFFDACGILRQPPENGLIDGHEVTIEHVINAYETYRNS